MNDEQTQTIPGGIPEGRKWVTVDEAFLLCQEARLDRTKKTIRSWCRQEHVESQKQTTPNGERWMVEASSLSVKIRNELEFQRQADPVRSGVNQFEQVQPGDTPVHTSAHSSEPVRTRTDASEQVRDLGEDEKLIDKLKADVRSLEFDKAVRDRHVDFLSNQIEEGQRNLLSQSRYIGHLETQVLQLGGRPDQQFLEAPVPGRGEQTIEHEPMDDDTKRHPDQRPFDTQTDHPIQS